MISSVLCEAGREKIMVKVLIGGLVGGVALFVWQYAAWMMLDLHRLDVEPQLANETAVIEALEGEAHGVYWIPGMSQDTEPESEAYKLWESKHQRGPLAFIVYQPEGGEAMPPRTMIIGALISILGALMISWMLRGAAISSYLGRVAFVTGFGIVLAILVDAQMWNWMHYPIDWVKGYALDRIGGMAVLGILLGFIVTPDTDRP